MKKLRSVNTKFWGDSFIEKLQPEEKLLFLYLLTNPLTNVLGIYEITIKRIVFDTGLNDEIVLNAFKEFESLGKVNYINGFIILSNFLKNQSLNPNMKKGALDVYLDLPDKIKQLSDYKEDVKDFESLLNALKGFEKGNSNIKMNSNMNIKEKGNANFPTFDLIFSFFASHGKTKEFAQKFFNYYNNRNWQNGKGEPVIWQEKAERWFETENDNFANVPEPVKEMKIFRPKFYPQFADDIRRPDKN